MIGGIEVGLGELLLAFAAVFATIVFTLVLEWLREWKSNSRAARIRAHDFNMTNYQNIQSDLQNLAEALDAAFIPKINTFLSGDKWIRGFPAWAPGTRQLSRALAQLQVHASRIPLVALPSEINDVISRVERVQVIDDGHRALDEIVEIKRAIQALQFEVGKEIRLLLSS